MPPKNSSSPSKNVTIPRQPLSSAASPVKRTLSSVKAQNLASSVANAFARTNSNLAEAVSNVRKNDEEPQQQQQQKPGSDTKTEDSPSSKSKSSSHAQKQKHHHASPASLEQDAFIGSAFDPLPDDQNPDDVIDDLLPHRSRAAGGAARLHLRGHGDAVKSCCFDVHHRLLFTASWDGLVLVWHLERPSSTPVARLQHREWVNAVATTYVPDLTVISVTEDGYLFGWQCEDYMVEKELTVDQSEQRRRSNFAAASSSSSVMNVATSKSDNGKNLDNPTLLGENHRQKRFEIVAQVQVSFGALTCLAIHSDFNFAFCSSGATTFGVHLSSGSILREYVTATEAASLATVDAVLCIAQTNGAISLYDVVGGFILRELTGHRGAVRCMSVIDSYTIMSAGDDASVRVWNIASGACQSNRRRVHNRAIVAISHFYTDRDRVVVTAGLDGAVKVTRQSNGVAIATFGLLCTCFCLVPPVAVDPSNLDDVVDMLTDTANCGGDDSGAEQQKPRKPQGAKKLWRDQPAPDDKATVKLAQQHRERGREGGGGEQSLLDISTDSDDPNRVTCAGDDVTIPGTNDKETTGNRISRHSRWSFFQTMICGGPTGKLTRLSLEAVVTKDEGTRDAYRY